MFELTINEKVYQFRFGMGFIREINKTMSAPIDGVPGEKQNVGLRYKIGCLHDNDVEALVEVLNAANKTENPRVTVKELDSYIENPDTDIEKLFEDVLDFLRQSNATKKVATDLQKMVDEQKKQQAQQK
jgi:hypothetical protein